MPCLHTQNTEIPYDMETDASDDQLGHVIKQENCPVTYFSRKLNNAQKNYTTIEKRTPVYC